jgi:hypothetical protein
MEEDKGKLFNIRMPIESRMKLDQMAVFYRRSLTDMVLWLIDVEYARLEQQRVKVQAETGNTQTKILPTA